MVWVLIRDCCQDNPPRNEVSSHSIATDLMSEDGISLPNVSRKIDQLVVTSLSVRQRSYC